jgi:hypothetical protein
VFLLKVLEGTKSMNRTVPAFSFDLKLLLTNYLMKISYLLIF